MTLLLVRKDDDAEGHEIIFDDTDEKDKILFWVTFSTSIITPSLGLAKNLKVGPCRILPEQRRCLGGLLSPRFVLIFLSCGSTFVTRGYFLVGGISGGTLAEGAMTLSTLFLPGFLIGLFASWHKGILKTFVAHPSVFLLPMFTHFTFAPNPKVCCGKKPEDSEKGLGVSKEDTFITFSPKYTAINVGVSAAGALTYALTIHLFIDSMFDIVFSLIIIFILGLPSILSLAAALSNQFNCCRSCCCCSCITEPFEIGALLPSATRTPYVLGSDGQLRKLGTDIESNVQQEEEEEEEEQEEQEEQEENEEQEQQKEINMEEDIRV